jgi:hypothetical protein
MEPERLNQGNFHNTKIEVKWVDCCRCWMIAETDKQSTFQDGKLGGVRAHFRGLLFHNVSS